MKTDAELLQEFVRIRSEEAFAELVRRHVDLVYSAALRQVNGDVHLAQDVAQRVFIDLARKAASLSARDSLVGWLYTCAHHAACNAVRSERRRRVHEQEAQAMHEVDYGSSHDWEKLRPLLDAAMLELAEADRDAVLRRYFSGESFGTIGVAMNVSEEAARKRVDRALERLHGLIVRRGITSGASAVALALSHHAVSAAPLGFSAAVTEAALGGSPLIAGGGILLMSKIAVGLSIAALALLLSILTVEYRENTRLHREAEEQSKQRASLQRAIDRTDRGAAAARAKLVDFDKASSNVAAKMPDPLRPVTGAERAALDSTYASMFRRLKLDLEKLAVLKDLLVLRGRSDREVQAEMKARGVNPEWLKSAEREALQLIAARDVDRAIGVLLGEDGLKYVQTYVATLRPRKGLVLLNTILFNCGEPFSPEQEDQLVALVAEETPENAPLEWITDRVVARVTPFLTPLQLEKLGMMKAVRTAELGLIAFSRSAAEKGRLGLKPSSTNGNSQPAQAAAAPSTKGP